MRKLIGAALLVLLLAGHQSNAEARHEQARSAERTADALQNIASTYEEDARRSESSEEKKPCTDGHDNPKSDLCAQWKAANAAAESADWAKVSGVFSGVGLLGVAVAIGLTLQSNRIARNALFEQTRPWVFVESIKPAGVSRLAIKFINDGKTPAKSFDKVVEAQLFPYPLEQLSQLKLTNDRTTFLPPGGKETILIDRPLHGDDFACIIRVALRYELPSGGYASLNENFVWGRQGEWTRVMPWDYAAHEAKYI